MAEAIAKSGAMSIFVGGDFIKAIKESGFADDVSFISTMVVLVWSFWRARS